FIYLSPFIFFMNKVVTAPPRSRAKAILLTLAAFLVFIFIIIPLSLVLFDGKEIGNVALIPVSGIILGDGGGSFDETVSSQDLVQFIEEADADPSLHVIVLEINSPGGSAVASDEVAAAVKNAQKPVIALIREAGASGAYWIASATDYIIANRMSITGSIGVVSSYLEFSGLMEKYGIKYEQLIAGKYKDLGNPYQSLDKTKRTLFQSKIDRIHDYFIHEIAVNRNLPEEKVRAIATGEFFLGSEAKELGLIDEIGDKNTVEQYIKEKYALPEVNYVHFEKEGNLFDILTGVLSSFSFEIGRGIGASVLQNEHPQAMMVLS
ncbi:signal peptide peptidase SppA, partial [Candidatus Woesearchaeota archaeon]|nr:signal peptide peptidase SppA [Candidatus Woesearchaeota archaeon]